MLTRAGNQTEWRPMRKQFRYNPPESRTVALRSGEEVSGIVALHTMRTLNHLRLTAHHIYVRFLKTFLGTTCENDESDLAMLERLGLIEIEETDSTDRTVFLISETVFQILSAVFLNRDPQQYLIAHSPPIPLPSPVDDSDTEDGFTKQYNNIVALPGKYPGFYQHER